MKKIVYIGNNIASGNPTTLGNLSKLFKENGFTVCVYGSNKNKGLRLFEMILGVLKNRKADFVLIDTYSTNNYYYAFIISQLCRFFKLRYIPILHGGNLAQRLNNNPKLSNLIFKYSFINVSPSKYLDEVFKNNNYNVEFIPNPLKLSEYPYKKRKYCKPNLLWVRAFDEIYNPKMAIEVVSELKKKGFAVNLCMVGPDKDGSLQKVENLAKELNVYNRIEFTGFLDKNTWFKKSIDFNIFINTTTIDNVPVSVIEAMALGLPVISTNVGGIPYLIDDGVNGLLVDNNNVNKMVAQIIYLMENDKVYETIGLNAKQFTQQFDVTFIIEKWLKILNV